MRGRVIVLLTVVGVVIGGVVLWLTTDPHRPLELSLAEVGLPEGLELVHEERAGNRQCFFECPSVRRAYLTIDEPEQVCDDLRERVEDWPGEPTFEPDPPPAQVPCRAGTRTRRDHGVSVTVQLLEEDVEAVPGTIVEIPPEFAGGVLVGVAATQPP